MALELCRGQAVQGGMHTLAQVDIFQLVGLPTFAVLIWIYPFISISMYKIRRTVLDASYTDFVNLRITRFKSALEFMKLFRIAAPFSSWEEREDGSFIVRS